MRLLIIGGGIFLGRTLIESAIASGHRVTAFSRGHTPLPCREKIQVCLGDRNEPADLETLSAHGPWDAIIDTCAYWPAQVEKLIHALRHSAAHYTFISSVAAYADLNQPQLSESSPLAAPLNDSGTEITRANYGPLKAACEHQAKQFGNPWIVRPGIIAGPYDPTDRFTYWVDLIRRDQPILVPNDFPAAAFQVIDVRDLAEWILRRIAAGATGPINAVGPARALTSRKILLQIAEAFGKKLSLIPLSHQELIHLGADPLQDFPFYIPPGLGIDSLLQIAGNKARAEGLTLRPIADTARDIATWLKTINYTEFKVGWPAAKMALAQAKH